MTKKSNRQLARELGISHRTVGTKRGRGLSDQEIADQAHTLSNRHDPMKRRRQEQLASVDSVEAPVPAALGAMAEASLRKEQAEARLKELKLEEEEGRLIDINIVGQELSRLVRECRDNMLGMASRLAPRVASLTDERQIHLLLTDEIEQSLHKVTMELEHYAQEV